MRLLSLFSKFTCTAGIIALGMLSSASAVSAEELVGTPVPVEADRSPQTMPIPPSAATVESMARQVANEEAIVRNMERIFEEGMKGKHGGHPEPLNLDFIVPVVAMLVIFGGPICLLGFLMVLNYRNKRRREANININIDKLLAAGRDIPVELLRGDEPRAADADEDGSLNKGIKNICVGTGLLIFLTMLMGIKIGSVAFILIGLGVSRVLVWKLGQNNQPNSQPQSVQAQD